MRVCVYLCVCVCAWICVVLKVRLYSVRRASCLEIRGRPGKMCAEVGVCLVHIVCRLALLLYFVFAFYICILDVLVTVQRKFWR